MIKVLEVMKQLDEDIFLSKEYFHDESVTMSLVDAEKILLCLQEMHRVMKLQNKADGYLAAHGWDWSKYDTWRPESEVDFELY